MNDSSVGVTTLLRVRRNLLTRYYTPVLGRSRSMAEVTDIGALSWKVVRVAGEDVVGGDLSIEEGELRFRPGRGHGSAPAAWPFKSELTAIADVTTVERTLQNLPFSLERGIRIRTLNGSQAAFYLLGCARDRADVVVAGLRELAKSSRGFIGAISPGQTTYVDEAGRAPLGGSTSALRKFQSYAWLFGLFGIAIFTPELVAALRETSGDSGLTRAWALIHPGNFIAISIWMVAGRFITARNHPLLAMLPISLYLVGSSILALVIYAFFAIPTSAALAPFIFGIPAAIFMAVTLSPNRRRAWREARDNDKRISQAA